MCSREIAELTGKEHKNVLADIRKMFTELNFQPSELTGGVTSTLRGASFPASISPSARPRSSSPVTRSPSALASSTAGWNCRKQLQFAVQGSKSVPECASNFGETSAQVEMPWGDMGILDFQETPYIHPQNRQTYRSFEMDRNGFTLLLIGFTGKNRITPAIRKHAVLDRDPTAGRLPAS